MTMIVTEFWCTARGVADTYRCPVEDVRAAAKAIRKGGEPFGTRYGGPYLYTLPEVDRIAAFLGLPPRVRRSRA